MPYPTPASEPAPGTVMSCSRIYFPFVPPSTPLFATVCVSGVCTPWFHIDHDGRAPVVLVLPAHSRITCPLSHMHVSSTPPSHVAPRIPRHIPINARGQPFTRVPKLQGENVCANEPQCWEGCWVAIKRRGWLGRRGATGCLLIYPPPICVSHSTPPFSTSRSAPLMRYPASASAITHLLMPSIFKFVAHNIVMKPDTFSLPLLGACPVSPSTP